MELIFGGGIKDVSSVPVRPDAQSMTVHLTPYSLLPAYVSAPSFVSPLLSLSLFPCMYPLYQINHLHLRHTHLHHPYVNLISCSYLCTLFCFDLIMKFISPSIVRVINSRRMRWAGHVARMGKRRGVYRVLVGKPEGKRPPGRPRRRWEDNIKMDLQEVGRSCGDWMEFAQDRDRWRAVVNAVMNHRFT